MSNNAPWTGGRVLSGLFAGAGLVAIVVSMFLSFISGDGEDNFWGHQKVEMDPQTWTCTAEGANQICETNIGFGEIVDRGSSFPVTVALFGVGMIGVSIMLRLRPTAQPAAPAAAGPPVGARPMPGGYPRTPPQGHQPLQ
jgi:hypothetical protein